MKQFKTQGTHLFLISSGSPTVLQVGSVTEAPDPLGGDTPDIDTTPLEELVARRFLSGLETPNDATFQIILDGDSDAHDELLTLRDSKETTEFYVGLSDSDAAPTLGSGDSLEHPVARSGFIFTASVRNFEMPIPLDEVVRATVTLRRSGATNRQILPSP